MHHSSFITPAVLLALLTPAALAKPKLEKINDAKVTLDLENRHEVPIPGGSRLGLAVTKVTTTSESHPEMDGASCEGYSWTTTYNAGKDSEYVHVEVRMQCVTSDGVPFDALEEGYGKTSATTLRRITYSIGEPYQHMNSEFYLAEVTKPVPDLQVTVYKVNQ